MLQFTTQQGAATGNFSTLDFRLKENLYFRAMTGFTLPGFRRIEEAYSRKPWSLEVGDLKTARGAETCWYQLCAGHDESLL